MKSSSVVLPAPEYCTEHEWNLNEQRRSCDQRLLCPISVSPQHGSWGTPNSAPLLGRGLFLRAHTAIRVCWLEGAHAPSFFQDSLLTPHTAQTLFEGANNPRWREQCRAKHCWGVPSTPTAGSPCWEPSLLGHNTLRERRRFTSRST
jgi:hypothetical protein